MELRYQVKQSGALFQGQASEIVQKRLNSTMHEAVMFLEREVKRIIEAEGRMGVGGSEIGLFKSVAGEVLDQGSSVIKGIVGHSKSYGEVIEKGRRPGKAMPPEGVLLQWIQLKMGLSGKSARRVEFLIRRKIGRKGFPGIHMFERAYTENRGKIQKMFEKSGFEISEDLGRVEI